MEYRIIYLQDSSPSIWMTNICLVPFCFLCVVFFGPNVTIIEKRIDVETKW